MDEPPEQKSELPNNPSLVSASGSAKSIEDFLTPDECAFVRAVVSNSGRKKPYDGDAIPENAQPLWKRPEELELITCVGSWKWVPGPRLITMFLVSPNGEVCYRDESERKSKP